MTSGVLVAAALAVALAGAARAEDAAGERRVRIGLQKLRASGVAPALAEAVEERVCAVLLEVAAADVTCPSDVAAAALLARNAAMFGECAPDECLQRVEAARAADGRVTGSLERAGKRIVLSLQLSAPDGSGSQVVESLPEDLDELLARLPAAVRKLLR